MSLLSIRSPPTKFASLNTMEAKQQISDKSNESINLANKFSNLSLSQPINMLGRSNTHPKSEHDQDEDESDQIIQDLSEEENKVEGEVYPSHLLFLNSNNINNNNNNNHLSSDPDDSDQDDSDYQHLALYNKQITFSLVNPPNSNNHNNRSLFLKGRNNNESQLNSHKLDSHPHHLRPRHALWLSISKSKYSQSVSLSNSPTTSSISPTVLTPNNQNQHFAGLSFHHINNQLDNNTKSMHLNLFDTAGQEEYSMQPHYEDFYWYFAIGSMINPTSLALRGIFPMESHPSLVKNFALIFDGCMGMASIAKDEAGQFHGVLHKIKKNEIILLDAIERGYNRECLPVYLYDGRVQYAYAYMMEEKAIDRTQIRDLPSERYIDIIIRGCRYFGVSDSHIEWLSNLNCVPRKKPIDFLFFEQNRILSRNQLAQESHKSLVHSNEENECKSNNSDDGASPSSASSFDNLPLISMCELSTHNGSNEKVGWFSVNKKVIQVKLLEKTKDNEEDPVYKCASLSYHWISQYFGRDASLTIASFIYEPVYKVPHSVLDMEPEHFEWVEDLIASKLKNPFIQTRLVGKVCLSDIHHHQQAMDKSNNIPFVPCVLLRRVSSNNNHP